VLADFVRQRRLVTLHEAVRKMTALPAARFGLEQRGLIRPGYRADLTVFDASRVCDTATFSQPQTYPDGIPHVLVNGEIVVRDGEHTGRRPGRVLYSASRRVA
jgi:N-acyl-D-amino-acid deacylase